MAHAAHHIYHHFLESGIQIFEYQKRILHAKSVIVDRVFSTIGSLNFDVQSEHRNLELNLAMLDAKQAQDLCNHFWDDMADARELTLRDLGERSYLRQSLSFMIYFGFTKHLQILDGIRTPYTDGELIPE